MWIYEVNIELKPEIFESYSAWLRPHMAQVLESEGFHSAEVLLVEAESLD